MVTVSNVPTIIIISFLTVLLLPNPAPKAHIWAVNDWMPRRVKFFEDLRFDRDERRVCMRCSIATGCGIVS